MKVRVKQSYSTPAEEGRWQEHRVGDVIEIEPDYFAPNLHEKVKEPDSKKRGTKED